jgi:signal transduction protein with GAF and PtsI domain
MSTLTPSNKSPVDQDPIAQELNLLHRISMALGYDLSLGDVLQLVVNMTADLMGSKICSILLYDESLELLSIAATQSLSDAYRHKPDIRLDASVSGKAVRERKAVAVADVREEPSYGFQDLASREGIVSMLCVPMVVKNRVVGVINSYTARVHEYSPKEITLLSLVASQAAVAIENARLNAATAAIRQDLETRKLVDKAKGILMSEKSLTEPEAFRMIQKQSMNSRKPMRKIAEAIIMAAEVRELREPGS